MDEFSEILLLSKDKSIQLEQDKTFLKPYDYICKIPGKKNRSKISRAFNYWLDVPMEKLDLVHETIQMLHNCSLLIDDMEDDSNLRRGVPVAHSIYGVATTLNTSFFVSCIVLDKILVLNHPKAMSVFIEEILDLHRGQGSDIYWRDTFTIPTESEYTLMAVRKKGGLFRLSIKLMQLFSANKKDFSKLISILGLYFQIMDDYSNMDLKAFTGDKSFCEDLTEGKFSFPIIHALQNKSIDKEILNILRQRTEDVEVKKYCISLLEANGSLKYTRDVLESLDKQAREEMERFGANPLMEGLLNELLSWKAIN